MTLPLDPTALLPQVPAPVTLPFRKEARIESTICTEPLCFAAIPVDRAEAHAQWHEKRRRKQ
jgi:hypothetical protein